ncbi:cytoplasmic chaperone TorD [Deferribacter desulfuricans SSM1]|uniref:Cytoplasmic chaperone TorD n=1 Tax=Deferribacter desulfuricans (strain DSM 14783 / JCM 11476 / NBRC 101012 / SSM1) TaxID=639282 RepID=D3P8P3_DEFDS|nr:molecular chaperone TorD family protein [Deferribacter desulfuricans]BAI81083.1 cytoplasmic chaperone TorD [Deferribacter desulfuricans SSM1]
MIDFSLLKESLLKEDFSKIPDSLKFDEIGFESLSSVFFILSLCFRYPDDNVYNKLKELLPSFKDFFEDYLNKELMLEDQSEMEAEYVRLFVTNYGGVIAVPYASFYLEEEKLLMGESTVQLRDMMEEEGFILKEDIKEVPDHIYILLEFASSLINKIIDLNKSGEDYKKTLATLFTVLYAYIGRFVVDFSDKVINESKLDFYRDAAKALKGLFVEIDEIFIDILEAN